jgi:hypothetical protein
VWTLQREMPVDPRRYQEKLLRSLCLFPAWATLPSTLCASMNVHGRITSMTSAACRVTRTISPRNIINSAASHVRYSMGWES